MGKCGNCSCGGGVKKALAVIRPSIKENARIQIDEVLAITFHNAGDTVVTIDGHFTIYPKSTFQMAAPTPDLVYDCVLNVRFATATAGQQNRLEIMESRLISIAS